MRFADKLKKLMSELGISQIQISQLTGIGKSSISQYVSGRNEPSEERKKAIAIALGVEEDYFTQFDDCPNVTENVCVNLPVDLVARLMGKSKGFVTQGLQDGVFPWGYGVKMKEWSYFISSVKFTEYTGIEVPIKETAV